MEKLTNPELHERYNELDSLDLTELSEQRQILVQNIKDMIMEILVKQHWEKIKQ